MAADDFVQRTVIADRGDHGCRLDHVLQRRLHDVRSASRTRVQRWIENGQVAVNGRPALRPASRTAVGDTLVIALPAAVIRRDAAKAEDVPLDVLFEDAHLLAVNKPPGMVAHPAYRHAEGTLINALVGYARLWPAGQRPSLVGRLDQHTSGLVLVAKTPALHAALQRELTSSRATKDYLAVVYGRVGRRCGAIHHPLARDPSDRRRVVVSSSGARSETQFERLAQRTSAATRVALLRCRLVTGRMHQIRVHLAASGWPIVGDTRYGGGVRAPVADPVLARALGVMQRQALHAWRVGLVHPATGQPLSVEAPVPADLRVLLDAICSRT